MEEGLSLSVVMSGATLVSALGILAKLWISGRTHKIEQPLRVEPTTCERQIKSNSEEHANIFARLSLSEQRLSAVETSVVHVGGQLQRIDQKLDTLLLREERRHEG